MIDTGYPTYNIIIVAFDNKAMFLYRAYHFILAVPKIKIFLVNVPIEMKGQRLLPNKNMQWQVYSLGNVSFVIYCMNESLSMTKAKFCLQII